MTPPKARERPAPPSASSALPDLDDLGVLQAKIAANPEAFDTILDVDRVPANGDSRGAVYVADMPRDSLINEPKKWLARNVGAGSFRLQARTAAGGFSGSAIVHIGADLRPEEEKRRAPAVAPTVATPPAPAFDLAQVMIASMQQQTQLFTTMMMQREDPLDRLIKMREAGLLPAPTPPSHVDSEKLLSAGVELGEKLAKVGGLSKFLDAHGGDLLEGGLGVIDIIKQRLKGRPVTVDAQPAQPVQPAKEEPPTQPSEEASPLWPEPVVGDVPQPTTQPSTDAKAPDDVIPSGDGHG